MDFRQDVFVFVNGLLNNSGSDHSWFDCVTSLFNYFLMMIAYCICMIMLLLQFLDVFYYSN